MDENEDPAPAKERTVASVTEASLRSEITDLLLGRPRDVRRGRTTREQRDVLQQIEEALEVYGSYFYPPELR
jgi:hypothetical protein